MSKRTWIMVGCIATLSATLWAQGKEDKKDAGAADAKTSFNLAYATYSEQAGRVGAVVSSYGATFEEADKFFMLQVAVGIIGKFGAELDFTDQSFTLLDSQGNLYAMAPANELAEQQKLLDWASEIQRNQPIQTPRSFANLVRVDSDFYADEGLHWTSVHVNYDSYFADVVFFPKPKSGFNGVFTLNVLTKGMEAPVMIRFEFPPDKTKDKDAKSGS